eukprot:TRINITY_DN10176_c0_g1_i1.p1 TRINITY_DN10176_c0_g1~~TRINITY_DN10176_c0_g1_i1.p1  ORF type:complete len:386 (+),score=132.43 TRINITY_DN10176_c0_g1_i1:901-2058(+)
MAESSISPELLPQISALFQDAIDQLAVLGGVSNQGDQSLQIATVVGDEIGRIVDEQRELELVYDELLSERAALQQSNDNVGLNANDQKLRDTAKQLKNSTATLVKALRQKPGAADAIIKVQAERKFVQNALEVALGEIKASRTFESLADVIEEDRHLQETMASTILKEKESRAKIKQLRQQIASVKEQKEREIQEQNELIAQLKDRKQEARVRVDMEGSYVRREAEMQVEMAEKRKNMSIEQLAQEVEKQQAELEQEARVHTEIQEFLKQSYDNLSDQLDKWSLKYEDDTEAKRVALDELKANQARDLRKLQELTEQYNEYDTIVKQDAKRKEKMKEAAERAVKELAAAIRLQAWWRGMLVRHKLGPFKVKKSAKKGKKGKKKKK